MDGMLSQDEINALLNGMSADDSADNEHRRHHRKVMSLQVIILRTPINQRPFLILRKMQLARYLI